MPRSAKHLPHLLTRSQAIQINAAPQARRLAAAAIGCKCAQLDFFWRNPLPIGLDVIGTRAIGTRDAIAHSLFQYCERQSALVQ